MGGRAFRVLADLLPPALHEAAWEVCQRPRWGLGFVSKTDAPSLPFWHMDLDGEAAIDAAWQHAQPTCEAIAGVPLSVLRQYANGHTYGQGGRSHIDDAAPGSFTLLYYPMQTWQSEWEGETLFFDAGGEINGAVLPAPNRAIFFDSRIPHAGTAPSRFFGGLRVTIAFKLRAAGA